jgi:hypothetical protein
MALPTEPVKLGVEEIEELSQHFSAFRHDVNNSVGLIGAAAELMRYNPDAAKRWSTTMIEQPARIAGKTREFIAEAERRLTIRNGSEASWYRDLWPRTNAPPAEPAAATEIAAATVKALHGELLQFNKELTQLAFSASGADVLAGREPALAREGTAAVVEQLGKATRKFEQFAALFEKSFRVSSAPHRLLTAVPSGPVTLSPDVIGLFHRQLMNLQNDIHEHLALLLELSRIARTAPEQLQARAPELAQHAPKISAEIQNFSIEFDTTFGISRGG